MLGICEKWRFTKKLLDRFLEICQYSSVMITETRRAAIRRQYRLLRAAAEKTQIQVETTARLDAGRYWKIENGFIFPSDDERKSIAKVLKVSESVLPSETQEAVAS